MAKNVQPASTVHTPKDDKERSDWKQVLDGKINPFSSVHLKLNGQDVVPKGTFRCAANQPLQAVVTAELVDDVESVPPIVKFEVQRFVENTWAVMESRNPETHDAAGRSVTFSRTTRPLKAGRYQFAIRGFGRTFVITDLVVE